MPREHESAARRLTESIMVERREAKYIIPTRMIEPIREFIRPFCSPDRNCTGDPPEYTVTTLQLDTPGLSLHHAKVWDAISRFKLRVRTYGTDGRSPLFVEIKRKLKGVIIKSRARVPRDRWCRELVLDPLRKLDVAFRSSKEEYAFLDFVRIVREIGASPKVLIRYNRESYVSHVDQYARVTFDRNLRYQPTESWTSFGEDRRWRSMDTGLIQGKQYPFSGIVLEIKAMSNLPTWIVQLVENFDLVTTSNCKYSSALWNELLFRGSQGVPQYAGDLLTA